MTEKVALAYSFGVESSWIRGYLHQKDIDPLLILFKSYKDKATPHIRRLLKGEKYIIIRRIFWEHFHVRQDKGKFTYGFAKEGEEAETITSGPETRFRCCDRDNVFFTNAILEWARKQPKKPFDVLYSGRKMEDLEIPNLNIAPPTEAFGFKLEFPLWNWTRSDQTLFPPETNLIITVR
jgi:hypothetical protein